MTRYLMDTNHAAALMQDDRLLWGRVAALDAADEVGLCRPSVGELWYMVLNSSRVAENRARLESLLTRLLVHEYGAAAAEEFGRVRVDLRRAGRPIPQIDAQIAAIARLNGLTVLTTDSHFTTVPQLRTENWRS